jgi:plastocyanin
MGILLMRARARLQIVEEIMGKRVRLLLSALAVVALVASLLIGAVSVGASITPIKIGVDNAGPSGHNFEYVDFFPRTGAVIHNGDIVDFAWNPAAVDGFHTVTFVPTDQTPEYIWGHHPLINPDADDGAGSLQFNTEIFSNQPPSCVGDSAAHACSFNGSSYLSSAGLANPQNGGPHFFVKVNLDLEELDTSLPLRVKFVCLIHPGMKGSLLVAPGEGERAAPASTQDTLDALSRTQLTSDTNGAVAAETAANTKSVATNTDGTHTITMSAGTASNYVEVLEMLPSQVDIKPGDHVKWVTTAKKDPHTVTFPNGTGSNSVDPFGQPVCEGTGTTDTPATAGPPFFGCTPETPLEAPLNWKPVGDPVIKTTTTVATSGIIATIPDGPFPNNYTFTFPNAGSFSYMCRIHDHMVGTVLVAAPPAAPPVLAQTGGGSPWRSLPVLLGALALLCGLAVLRLRPLLRH